jgi:hypothetical protein
MVGHTKCYVKVLIKREEDLVGKRAIVKITDVHKWHIYGEVIERNPTHVHVNFEHHFKGMYGIKKDVEDNIMNIIKKEQEDIHATMIFENNDKDNDVETKEIVESVPVKNSLNSVTGCGFSLNIGNFNKFILLFVFFFLNLLIFLILFFRCFEFIVIIFLVKFICFVL